MPKKCKTFVIDTNVILHDHQCIYKFDNNDIVIPIPVLEELDKFKKGNDPINFQAREFTRVLDSIVGDKLFNGGLKLGVGKGKLRIVTGKTPSEELKRSFRDDIPDHRILAIADFVKQEDPKRCTVFVTKDVNLRMKAKSLGIMAEDYQNDKVINIDLMDEGVRTIEGYDADSIKAIYSDGSSEVKEWSFGNEPIANEFFILKNGNNSVLAKYNAETNSLERVEKHSAYGIKPRNAEQTFSLNALTDDKIQLITLTGKAGTGKTLLALAAAIEQHDKYDQILLARPIVALSNKDMGFLPGDAEEKIRPYMQPLFDNLNVIKHALNARSVEYKKIETLKDDNRLVIEPLAYIRGRSLSNTFFIVDEAQNLTPHEVRTIVTRAGEGTKIVFTGDIQQIDSPYLDARSNGLAFLTDKMREQDIFAHINLVRGERSYLAELASNLL
ncbi:PhoH family protein [Prolixibacteraceae bacterium JC049]|nr:PhoH family protein [Prolixibacteraceae bacterium JC049]